MGLKDNGGHDSIYEKQRRVREWQSWAIKVLLLGNAALALFVMITMGYKFLQDTGVLVV